MQLVVVVNLRHSTLHLTFDQFFPSSIWPMKRDSMSWMPDSRLFLGNLGLLLVSLRHPPRFVYNYSHHFYLKEGKEFIYNK